MLPNVQRLIVSAIRNKRCVLIRYDGRSHSRVVEPHLLYQSQDGGLTLLAYQVRGYHSSKRKGSFWRPFQLRKIDSIYVMAELFEPRIQQGYKAVSELIRGSSVARVDVAPSRYNYFNPARYGPPTPAYLAPTPTMMLRLAKEEGGTPIS